jgi:tryptase
MRSVLGASALLLLVACGPQEVGDDHAWAYTQSGIVGGTESPSDTSVFVLDITRDGDSGPERILCSATLIGSHTLLTAGHCLAKAKWAQASNALRWTTRSSEWHTLGEIRLHPRYDIAFPTENDLALALLPDNVDVDPKPWNTRPLEGLAGAPLRAVGYGTGLTTDEGTGVRRSVDLTLREIDPLIVRLGDGTGKGICHGDSGGPSFFVFPDGVERLVGVHSFTSEEDCLDGGDTRADAYRDFISAWIVEKETSASVQTPSLINGSAPENPSCGGTPAPFWFLPALLARRRRKG